MYSKTCVKRPLSKRPTLCFQYQLSLYAGQKYCRMWSILQLLLQYFRPSLSYQLLLRSLFCLFLSDRFIQVILYVYDANVLCKVLTKRSSKQTNLNQKYKISHNLLLMPQHYTKQDTLFYLLSEVQFYRNNNDRPIQIL